MKPKKHLLKGVAIASLLLGSSLSSSATASSSKKQVRSKNKQLSSYRHTFPSASVGVSTPQSQTHRRRGHRQDDVPVVMKTMEHLIDQGLREIGQQLSSLPSSSTRTRNPLQRIYDQLLVLKDDVSHTLSSVLSQEPDVRQRSLTKIHRLLKELRLRKQKIRHQKTLNILINTIVALSFMAFLMTPWTKISKQQNDKRRRRVYRIYQAMEYHRQGVLGQQIDLAHRAPEHIPDEFLCPLSKQLIGVPVRIGDEPETYDAGSLLLWTTEHLPHYKKHEVMSALSVDEQLLDQINQYLFNRCVYRNKILPECMEMFRYFPGTGSQEYMSAKQSFQQNAKRLDKMSRKP
jgi:hypothetical protein